MAHNLATIAGQVSFAYQGSSPWHHLGKRVPSMTDIDAALRHAAMDWTVAPQPIYLANGSSVPDFRAIVREMDQTALGIVGDRYQPIQNREALAILEDALRELGVSIETLGALGKGEKCFALLRLPVKNITITDGDDVRGYFLLSWSHDGSGSLFAILTPVRVVCQNTLNMALSGGKSSVIRIKHTRSAQDRLTQAQTLVSQLIQALEQTGETFASLARKRMSESEVKAFVESVFPLPKGEKEPSTQLAKRRDQVLELSRFGVGAEMAGARPDGSTTLWGAYNAVTEYFDHVRPGESRNPTEANTSALFGTGQQVKLEALQLAQQLASLN
jgi:phage/plasmid-like protein (TIGR03299 family)